MGCIIFHDRCLSLRGSTRAVFDYAHYYEEILGGKSIIIFDRNAEENNPDIERMFRQRFEHVISYDYSVFTSFLDDVCKLFSPDLYYIIDGGVEDITLPDGVRSAVHQMFQVYQPRGDAFAYVSEWLSWRVTNCALPWVPHIVTLPCAEGHLRAKLGIPSNALLLGRHGGYDTFDITFVRGSIPRLLDEIPFLYLLFVNTREVGKHPRLFYIDQISDSQEKADFIASCDGMLHARARGETFGLAIAEFLSLDTPVLTYSGGYDQNHISLLGRYPELMYSNFDELRVAIQTLYTAQYDDGAFSDLVKAYRPDIVMRKFDKVFLQSPSRRRPLGFLLELVRVGNWRIRHFFYRLRKFGNSLKHRFSN